MADSITREVVAAIRVASTINALDAASWPAGATVLRIAPDEVLIVDALDTTPPEPNAVVFPDTGWVRFRITAAAGAQLMTGAAAWPAPTSGFGQGLIAGIPAKVVVGDEWWVLVLGAVADEFEQRLREVLA